MDSTDFSKLDELINHLRTKGVVHYRGPSGSGGYFELTLLPEEPVKPPTTAEAKQALEDIPLGDDGLTAEQQFELYGQVIDARKKE